LIRRSSVGLDTTARPFTLVHFHIYYYINGCVMPHLHHPGASWKQEPKESRVESSLEVVCVGKTFFLGGAGVPPINGYNELVVGVGLSWFLAQPNPGSVGRPAHASPRTANHPCGATRCVRHFRFRVGRAETVILYVSRATSPFQNFNHNGGEHCNRGTSCENL